MTKTIEERLASLEYDVTFLREENESRHAMIVAACAEINVVHDRIDKFRKDWNDECDHNDQRHKNSENIQDIIGEKLFTIF